MTDEKKRIDEEWKNRAAEEKQKIEAAMGPQERPGTDPSGRAPAEAPEDPADQPPSRMSFMTLISQLGSQALGALGQFEDPRTGQRHVDLDIARDTIDLLGILETKTRGNLTREEEATLIDMLQQLRMVFVSISRAAQEQMMSTPPPGEEKTPPR